MGIIHGAARTGDIVAVKNELRRGTDPDIPNKNGGTALVIAAGSGYVEIVRLLLDAGANLELSQTERASADSIDNSLTALMAAARSGQIDVVRLLLQAGADVNVRTNDRGETALMYAISSGNVEIISLLLENGADVHACTTYGQTVLDYAKEEENLHANYKSIIDTIKLYHNANALTFNPDHAETQE